MEQVYYFDELIVAEIKKNNEIALQELYKTHYPMIVNLVISNSGTEQEAKDVYQEAIIAFYEKIRSQDFKLTCKVKTFLYAICKHLWLKRLSEKKKYYTASVEDIEPWIGMEEDIVDVDAKEKDFKNMSESLSGLGEPCKSIIEDFYIKELSMDEISRKFGYTNADNAKNQKYKCLQRLKKLFFENYKE